MTIYSFTDYARARHAADCLRRERVRRAFPMFWRCRWWEFPRQTWRWVTL